MDEWDGWMDDEWMDGMDEWMNGMDGQTDGWTDGWIG